MHKGTVKFFNDTKGFGFIESPVLEGKDAFVHYRDIESGDKRRTLQNGQAVEFEFEEGPKGLKATRVRAL